jgi:hypothetical protein
MAITTSAAQQLRVAEGGGRQLPRGGRAQQGEVGVAVFAEQPRLHDAAFAVGQAHIAVTVDDMAVGQDESIRRNDDAGAEAAGRAPAVRSFHPHHRRADLVDDAGDSLGQCVEQDDRCIFSRTRGRRLAGETVAV